MLNICIIYMKLIDVFLKGELYVSGVKAWAGMMITRGCTKEKADFELKKMAVTIKISRELTLKNNSKN